MNDNAARIRKVLLLRRVALYAPWAVVVGAFLLAGLLQLAPDFPSESRRYLWQQNYLTSGELFALNALLPVMIGFVAVVRLWSVTVLRMPPWVDLRWYDRALLVCALAGSVIGFAVVVAHGGKWPNPGVVQ